MKVLMATAQHWKSPFQVGSHQLARAFLRNGWEVGFIGDPISPWHFLKGVDGSLKERYATYREGGRFSEDGKLWAYVPAALLTPHDKPLLRSAWVQRGWMNLTFPNLKAVVRAHGFEHVDLLYLDVPTQYFWLDAAEYSKSVYRISDLYRAFAKFPQEARKLERNIARRVDLTLYTAHGLEDDVRSLNPQRALYFPNGVDYGFFNDNPKSMPAEYASMPGPRIVYAGALDFWFDYAMLNEAARRLPDYSFILIGPQPLANKRLEQLANIHLLGMRPYNQLPAYYAHADVGIIPFDVGAYPDLVHAVHPLKLYEYMACGIPVVAARWKELELLHSSAALYGTVDEFVMALRQAVEQRPNAEDLKAFAKAADWQNRMEQLMAALGFDLARGAAQ